MRSLRCAEALHDSNRYKRKKKLFFKSDEEQDSLRAAASKVMEKYTENVRKASGPKCARRCTIHSRQTVHKNLHSAHKNDPSLQMRPLHRSAARIGTFIRDYLAHRPRRFIVKTACSSGWETVDEEDGP